MIKGIGIGIVEIRRMQRVLDGRPSALARWFTPGEIERARSRMKVAEDLSGRFACKLAVRNAVQSHTGGPSLRLNEIATGNDARGKPTVSLVGEAALHGSSPDRQLKLEVSITHARDWAAAVALYSTGNEALDGG